MRGSLVKLPADDGSVLTKFVILLPMMGFLFTLFFGGVIAGLFLLFIRPLRRFSGFALVPMLSSVTAFVACWGLALSLEAISGSDRVGTLGFLRAETSPSESSECVTSYLRSQGIID